jgi:hypothetical protein
VGGAGKRQEGRVCFLFDEYDNILCAICDLMGGENPPFRSCLVLEFYED